MPQAATAWKWKFGGDEGFRGAGEPSRTDLG
jgi:hypothetical protein